MHTQQQRSIINCCGYISECPLSMVCLMTASHPLFPLPPQQDVCCCLGCNKRKFWTLVPSKSDMLSERFIMGMPLKINLPKWVTRTNSFSYCFCCGQKGLCLVFARILSKPWHSFPLLSSKHQRPQTLLEQFNNPIIRSCSFLSKDTNRWTDPPVGAKLQNLCLLILWRNGLCMRWETRYTSRNRLSQPCHNSAYGDWEGCVVRISKEAEFEWTRCPRSATFRNIPGECLVFLRAWFSPTSP